MSYTKAELVEALFQESELSRREARELIDQLFELIRERLEQGHAIRLSGFGSFELRDKRRRHSRHPKTGELKPIAARRVVTFRAGRKLRGRLVREGRSN